MKIIPIGGVTEHNHQDHPHIQFMSQSKIIKFKLIIGRPFIRPGFKSFPHMIMGGPLSLPQMSGMEITFSGPGNRSPFSSSGTTFSSSFRDSPFGGSPFGNPFARSGSNFIKIFGPRRMNMISGSSLSNQNDEDISLGSLFNDTKLNNTIKKIENNLVDGVKKFEHYLNTTFESDIDKTFDQFFGGDDDVDIEDTNKQTTSDKHKANKNSIEVKSFVHHIEKGQKESPHKTSLSLETKSNNSDIPIKEIEREVEKTLQINKNVGNSNRKIEQGTTKENVILIEEKVAKSKDKKSNPSVKVNKALISTLPITIYSNYFSSKYVLYSIIGAIAVFLVVILALCSKCSNTKNQGSSTEKKFLENLAFNDTSSEKHSINRTVLY